MGNIAAINRISIVVPVYNSAPILPKLVDEILKTSERDGFDNLLEIIFVNDSSPDNSWEVICDLSKKYPCIKSISLMKNFGQHNATMAGFNYCTGDIVVVMDDDLQHPPSCITKMIARILEGYDVCYTHYLDRKHAIWKKIGSKINDWFAGILLGKPKGLYLSSFKAMKRSVVKEVIKYEGPYAYIDGLILNVTRSVTSVDIRHQRREIGEGNYNLKSSMSLWLKMATSFSVMPLRVATYIGFLFSMISFIFIIVVIVQKFLNPELQAGWASVIAVVLFIGGVQTFCIGLIGEYIGRTYLKLNGKPQFAVREIINFEARNEKG